MTDTVQRTVKGGRAAFFENAESDRLLAMLTRLMTEHWALKERVMALESLLAERGVLSEDAIESFQPDKDRDAAWDRQSFAFVQAVLEAGQNIERKNRD